MVLTLLIAQSVSAIAQSPVSSASASKSPNHSSVPSNSANAEILKMLNAGLPESVVLTKIHRETGTFDTSTDALIALKQAGASEAILNAILNHVNPADEQAAPVSQTPNMSNGALAQPSQTGARPSVTSASAAPAVISNTMAHVYFYRPQQLLGSALRPSIYCDNVLLATLGVARFFSVDIPAGTHDCYTDGETKQERHGYIKTGPKADIDLKAGNNYYFLINFHAGFGAARLPLTSMLPEQAESDIKQLHPLEGKYIFHNALPADVSTPLPSEQANTVGINVEAGDAAEQNANTTAVSQSTLPGTSTIGALMEFAPRGIRIDLVAPNGPANKVGLQAGDVILSADSVASNGNAISTYISQIPLG